MRRALTSLLLALLLSQTAMFFAMGESDLPACCRRFGKHHCSMVGSGQDDSSSVKLVSPKCPLFPGAVAPGTIAKAALLPVHSFAAAPHFPAAPLHEVNSLSRLQLTLFDIAQKRGPPSQA